MMAVESHAPTPERPAGDQSPSHHPPAPYDELFDVSTTIDPGYIISLIRKLLPNNDKDHGSVRGRGNCGGPDSSESILESDGMVCSYTAENCSQQCEGDKSEEDVTLTHMTDGEKADFEVWEESGCVLWDLSATKTHAEFMVQNLVLEVLLANLSVPKTDRVKEICLGIIGNLSCHDLPRRHIVRTRGLVEVIVDQLYSDDTPCLCEACRVITLGLQSTDCVTWGEALQSEDILTRVLWIVENALNPLLIERSVQILLAIIESSEVASLLLPPLINMGLPNLLIKLLNFEMNILMNDRVSERYSVVENILSTVEALSAIDDHSKELSSSKELLQLLCSLVKFPDKFEVSNCCISAAVLIANILSDTTNWASDLSTDLSFIHGLFEIFPFASDDAQANSALWTVLARVLVKIEESKLDVTNLQRYVSLLVSNSDHIEDSLLDGQSAASPNHIQTSSKPTAKTIALNKIATMLNCWNAAKDKKPNAGGKLDYENEAAETNLEMENIDRLLECCREYLQK